MEELCEGKDAVIAAKEKEIAVQQRALTDERQQVSSLNAECAKLKGSLEGKTEEIQNLQAHIRTLQVNDIPFMLWHARSCLAC